MDMPTLTSQVATPVDFDSESIDLESGVNYDCEKRHQTCPNDSPINFGSGDFNPEIFDQTYVDLQAHFGPSTDFLTSDWSEGAPGWNMEHGEFEFRESIRLTYLC